MFKIKILLHWLSMKRRGKFTSRKAIERYQRKRMVSYVRRLKDVPYYRHLQLLGMTDWPRIPLMSKETMLAHFNELNQPGMTLNQAMSFALEAEKSRAFSGKLNGITVGLSTGTSGQRAIFLVAESERAQWAAAIMSRVIKPRLFKRQNVAFFLRADGNLYSSVNSSLFQFAYFDIFKPMAQLVDELQKYQPDILAAQPAVLLELCSRQASGTLKIAPSSIISFAEVLHQRDKETIVQTFGVTVKEVYQCTEGFLGCTCEMGTMHLNEDFVLVEKEFIDEERFYPVVTDFTRTTQYIARYKLNDILKLKKGGCACGSAATAIECIEGRSDDVLLFINAKGEEVMLFPDVLSRRISWLCDEFDRYRVVQNDYTAISVSIECAPDRFTDISKLFADAFTSWMKEQHIEPSEVAVRFNKGVEVTAGSKFRKIQRSFNLNSTNI
jgi:putative adenylate-forming enzyme